MRVQGELGAASGGLAVQELDWDSIRARVKKVTQRKFPWCLPEDREDAVSDALVAVLETWGDFPSSKEALAHSRAKAEAYAVRWATWHALAALGDRSRELDDVTHIVDFDEDGAPPPRGTLTIELLDVLTTDTRTDDEREDEMLTKLLDRHGVDGLEASLDALAPTPSEA